tara:strand:- start:4555 stop:5925 length:1371 start_codon:yes stop_codon:yes gene_type:complete
MVALCLAKRTPMIWIDLTEPDLPVRQIFPGQLWADVHFGEFLHSLQEPGALELHAPAFNVMDLEEQLLPHYMPPGPPAPPQGSNGGHADAKSAGAHSGHAEPDMRVRYQNDLYPKPPKGWFLANLFAPLWSIAYKHPGNNQPSVSASVISGEVVLPDIHPMIASAFGQADERASAMGDAHRGTQIMILLIAPLAVLLATMPALHPSGKFFYVLAELVFILLAFFLYSSLVKFGSHTYWSDVRRLAERLRVLRATRPLAFDVADSRADPPATWTEWLARAVRRAAGPPCCLLDIAAKRYAIKFAQTDPEGILNHQVNYQAMTELRAGKLHERIHWFESKFFLLLIALLAGFLGWYLLGPTVGWGKPSAGVGAFIMIASAVIPVIAAIFMAIEGKFDLRENEKKAKALAEQFAKVSEQISDEANQSRDEELLREAALILLNDVDRWREGAIRRAPVNL